MEICQIREADANDWEEAMNLAWKTFLKFEAPVYPPRGTESFLEFISEPRLFEMFRERLYRMYIAVSESGSILGMITLRNETMISLLFVDEMYHRKGIGTQLIRYAASIIKEEYGKDFCIVLSAPYALNFYRKLGFYVTGSMIINDGIYSTPMRMDFNLFPGAYSYIPEGK